ncbi:hypothetical protein SISSUDRAFT_1037754 [Sistotremastrum suecicum HHB10207 ss-3]|uniref:Uncharacterized protein n=1 Tax=Sistotremastrum suecicum HHB10207 ss-3 TaxID=1314776 RepID=A0A165XQ39_9AGAM|nr:hypothetical protein SISSUDRAFT_1037754 [Sistotremastrum suecicum HHB10207 ss-3]
MPSLRHSRPQAIEALYRTIARHPLDRSLALMHHVRSEERVFDFTLEEIDYVLARIRRNLSRFARQDPLPTIHQPARAVNHRWISDVTVLSHTHHLSLSYGLDEFSGKILWHDVHVNWDYDTCARSMLEYIGQRGNVQPLAHFQWIPPFQNPRHANVHSHLRQALLDVLHRDLAVASLRQCHPAFESLPPELNAHDGTRYGDILLGYLSAYAQVQVATRVHQWNNQLPSQRLPPFPIAPPSLVFEGPHDFGTMNGGVDVDRNNIRTLLPRQHQTHPNQAMLLKRVQLRAHTWCDRHVSLLFAILLGPSYHAQFMGELRQIIDVSDPADVSNYFIILNYLPWTAVFTRIWVVSASVQFRDLGSSPHVQLLSPPPATPKVMAHDRRPDKDDDRDPEVDSVPEFWLVGSASIAASPTAQDCCAGPAPALISPNSLWTDDVMRIQEDTREIDAKGGGTYRLPDGKATHASLSSRPLKLRTKRPYSSALRSDGGRDDGQNVGAEDLPEFSLDGHSIITTHIHEPIIQLSKRSDGVIPTQRKATFARLQYHFCLLWNPSYVVRSPAHLRHNTRASKISSSTTTTIMPLHYTETRIIIAHPQTNVPTHVLICVHLTNAVRLGFVHCSTYPVALEDEDVGQFWFGSGTDI